MTKGRKRKNRMKNIVKNRRENRKNIQNIGFASFALFVLAAFCFILGLYISYKTVPWAMNGILMMLFLGSACIVHYGNERK